MTAAANAQAASDYARAESRLAASRQRLSMSHPFFASLLLMSEVRISTSVPTAGTDGIRIMVNPEFANSLRREELDGILVHEVLHCALLHVPRRGMRDLKLWNVAADIQVNGKVCSCPGLALPTGVVVDDALAHLSVEDIYQILDRRRLEGKATPSLGCQDLIPIGVSTSDSSDGKATDSTRLTPSQMQEHWQSAVGLARERARSLGFGDTGEAVLANFDTAMSTVNWRHELWRHITSNADDFAGFDRRLIARGLYTETLECDSLTVEACIDTSGSITSDLLGMFVAELSAILLAYPFISSCVRWCDTVLSKPVAVQAGMRLPKLSGGGGTDFRPFFAALESDPQPRPSGNCLAIYFTDGYGRFPPHPPSRHRVVWVVSPGGAPSSAFPFGDVIRIGT
jgi:predicted metal-dependent peptidase